MKILKFLLGLLNANGVNVRVLNLVQSQSTDCHQESITISKNGCFLISLFMYCYVQINTERNLSSRCNLKQLYSLAGASIPL